MNELTPKVTYSPLIVEDEPIFAGQLQNYIAQVQFLAEPRLCASGMEALQVMATTAVDIVFLDLSLPDMNGLDLLKASPRPNANTRAVIVTSAHHELAIDCFDLDIVDFLPKPYDFNRFLRAVSRVLQRIQSSTTVVDPRPTPPQKDEIFFRSGRRLQRFAYTDILYMEAYGLYTKMYTSEGMFAVNKRISVLTDELPKERFIRIHKSYIINIDHLKRLESKQIWVKTVKLPIGVTYHPIVHRKMQSLGISTGVN
ncbi:LytR/AlgR family response regulator transcription factor [Fibrella arboris]|uniref:LytR/AlgR family response regulator transcription factor n=1 Tax=Fibrella arboris TaxID=3242486 RepID=UPI003522812C